MEEIRNPEAELPTSYSFPSGNMQNVTSFFTSLMRHYRFSWLYAVGSFFYLAGRSGAAIHGRALAL